MHYSSVLQTCGHCEMTDLPHVIFVHRNVEINNTGNETEILLNNVIKFTCYMITMLQSLNLIKNQRSIEISQEIKAYTLYDA